MSRRDKDQSVRIIGGRWRRQRVWFPDIPTLRPTPDRVRETLFNWLQPWVTGARCLDLFAGSGVLALEALSRGAASVVAVDSHPRAVDTLRKNVEMLAVSGLDINHCDAREFLQQEHSQQFDIVFIDPPFDDHIYGDIAKALEGGSWMSSTALIYVESPKSLMWDGRPGWRLLRDKVAGQVSYRLFDLARERVE